MEHLMKVNITLVHTLEAVILLTTCGRFGTVHFCFEVALDFLRRNLVPLDAELRFLTFLGPSSESFTRNEFRLPTGQILIETPILELLFIFLLPKDQ